MSVALDTLSRPIPKAGDGGSGAGFAGSGGEGRTNQGGPKPLSTGIYYTAIWVALAPIVMLFAAFASSYIVRRDLSSDWLALELPRILWLNTLVLIGSSLALEIARRRLNAECLSKTSFGEAAHPQEAVLFTFRQWWWRATALGVMFVVGQFLAWNQLRQQGVFLETNPSSSFFYLLTVTHALHLLIGLGALMFVALRAQRQVTEGKVNPWSPVIVDLTAIYWHFLDGLWLALFVLFLICE